MLIRRRRRGLIWNRWRAGLRLVRFLWRRKSGVLRGMLYAFGFLLYALRSGAEEMDPCCDGGRGEWWGFSLLGVPLLASPLAAFLALRLGWAWMGLDVGGS